MNEQETITDIIRKTRAEADYIEETARGSLKAGENYDGIAFTESDLESALDLAETKRKEADRLDAAHKRERGDCAKLREALSKFCAYSAVVLNTGMFNRVHLEALLNMAKAALAAPPRNCDVGSPKEQNERYCKFCYAHISPENGCGDCPAFNEQVPRGAECELTWAQMPYESEAAK